jgi:hypothetical protein
MVAARAPIDQRARLFVIALAIIRTSRYHGPRHDAPATQGPAVRGLHGGYRAAARALGVSQAGLTKSLARLEEEYGVNLLHRTAKGVVLSPEGEEFVSHARAVLQEAELATTPSWWAAAWCDLPWSEAPRSCAVRTVRFRLRRKASSDCWGPGKRARIQRP